jgi:N-acetylmuramoyl-L-alanine amidase
MKSIIYDTRDLEVVAKTLYGEARGEPHEGQVAVAWVIRNRASRPAFVGLGMIGRPGALALACTMRWQFSCWNEGDPNREKLLALDVSEYGKQIGVASSVLDGLVEDLTNGADHYHTIARPGWAGSWPPDWAKVYAECARFGGHVFYNSTLPRKVAA